MTHRELNDFQQPIEQLREHDRKPQTLSKYSVPSSSREDMAHLVRQVKAYRKPWQECDIASEKDRVVVWLCSCESFQYQKWPTDGSIPALETLPQCKHCNVLKSEKAAQDEKQTELRFNE